MLKKLIEKIFGRRCACTTQSMCEHLNTSTKKMDDTTSGSYTVVEYCLDCTAVMEEK
jgi:hypothetical protein